MKKIISLLFIVLLMSCATPKRMDSVVTENVFFRGLGGMTFSTGMIDLADKSNGAHYCWCNRGTVTKDVIRRYKAGKIKDKVNIVGHSLGGNSATKLANALRKAGVPVGFVVTLDATDPQSLDGFKATNFMSRDFRAREVPGAKTIYRHDLDHIELNLDPKIHKYILDRVYIVHK